MKIEFKRVPTLKELELEYPEEYLRLQVFAILAILEEKGLFDSKEHFEELVKTLYEAMLPKYQEHVDKYNEWIKNPTTTALL